MPFAKSAFQKCIRRGMEKEALYLARQFYEAGQETWIWRRLLVITQEDIGVADLSVVKQVVDIVMTLNVAWRLIGKSKLMSGKDAKSDILALYNAVIVCCRAEKSRAADNCAVWFNSNPTWRPPLEDEFPELVKPSWCGKKVGELKQVAKNDEFVAACLDKHVPGKHDGKSLEAFLAAGAKLGNESNVVGFTPPGDASD
ncbi:MAG: hypothetical protein ACHP8B_10780 [Terriglobales bacterium]